MFSWEIKRKVSGEKPLTKSKAQLWPKSLV